MIWKDGVLLFHCSYLAISRDLKLGVAVIQNGPGSQCDSVGMTALRWAILDKQGIDWRTNRTYRHVDMDPLDYLWAQPLPKTLRLSVKDGALLATWMFGTYVEEPQNDTLAFQRGTHYRKGGAIQVFTTNGYELLQYSSYKFLDEAAIPILTVPSVTNGVIPFANGTQWYWFTSQSGQTYRVFLTAPNQNYFARLINGARLLVGAATNQPLGWACSADGIYSIAVSATNVFAYTLSLAG